MRGRWRDPGWRAEPRRDKRPRGTKCPWSKLREEDVAAIRADRTSKLTELAVRFGVSQSTIYCIKAGKTHQLT